MLVPTSVLGAQQDPALDASQELEKRKLELENDKLSREVERLERDLEWWFNPPPIFGAVIGALVGLIGAWAALHSPWRQYKAQRERDYDQRVKERQQETDAFVNTAFDNLTGKSQNRSVGIAALRIVRDIDKNNLDKDKDLWAQRYQRAAFGLLVAQLRFLLSHGENRWKSHEIRNIEDMMSWLIDEGGLQDQPGHGLCEAISKYIKDWESMSPKPKDAHPEAVESLKARMERWRPHLGCHQQPNRATVESPCRYR